MSLLNTFATAVLLATTPSILVYPQDMLPRSTFQIPEITYEATSLENDYMLSYDDMIRLLNEIESGELVKKCSAEQLANLKHFVALLAKEGVPPDNSEESLSLDDDINDLLDGQQNP